MSKPENKILKLPPGQRPNNIVGPDRPHHRRSTFETSYSARRINDPVFGMRAVIIHLLKADHDFAETPMHHIVPNPREEGYGKNSFSLINESHAISALNTLERHPEIEFGLSDPYQWSVSIGISLHHSACQSHYSEDIWQLETTAHLVKQCWRRYANLGYVVDASLLGYQESDGPSKAFPWDKLFALILANR